MLNSRFDNCMEETKKQLLVSYCERFCYCAVLWDNILDSVLTQMHVAYNSIFWLLFRLPTRGTICNVFVRNILNTFVDRIQLVYSLYSDKEHTMIQTIVLRIFMCTEIFKRSILF